MECTSEEKHKSEGFFITIRMVKMMLELNLKLSGEKEDLNLERNLDF